MRSLLQATAFFAASALAFVIPPRHHSHHDSIDATDGIHVYFSTPCQGCFHNAKEELDIEIQIHASTSICQSSSIGVNGVELSSHPSLVLFNANTTSARSAQQVVASWETSCLKDNVTLLSFHITQVGSTRIEHNVGFSASFRQGSVPEFLRLEHAAIDGAVEPDRKQLWTTPESNPDFVVVSTPAAIDSSLSEELQEELRRLNEIKAHIGRLHHKYMRQERRIFRLIAHDFHTCQGASCIFQTAIKKAPDFFELVKAHFRHRPDWSKLPKHHFHDFEDSHAVLPPNSADCGNDGASKYGFHTFSHPPDLDELPFPPPFDEHDAEDLPPPPPPPHYNEEVGHHGKHKGPLPLPPPPPPPPSDDESSPRPPPWRRPHHDGQSGHKHGEHPPWAGHRHPSHHRPHFFHRHGPHRHPFVFSIGSILFFVALSSLLFKCLRAKTGLFRNIRRKRDCAARREELCNRAAYQRAAIQHRWQRWWSQFRQPQSTSDYEEKRERILSQEDALETVMQSEISDLRRAHEIVGDLMRAEESRQRLYHEANFGSPSSQQGSPQPLNRQNSETSQTTHSTLPLYQPPPPSYDQELEGEITVVDGFSYTPSITDSTPASSVVDCNPRMSFETSMTIMK